MGGFRVLQRMSWIELAILHFVSSMVWVEFEKHLLLFVDIIIDRATDLLIQRLLRKKRLRDLCFSDADQTVIKI